MWHEYWQSLLKKIKDNIFLMDLKASRHDGYAVFTYPLNKTEILLKGCNVIVFGSNGNAIYCLTEIANFDKIAQYDLDYFASKCVASEYGRLNRSWYPEKAEHELINYYGLHPSTLSELKEDDILLDRNSLTRWLYDNYHNIDYSICGVAPSYECIFHWYAIKKIAQCEK